MELGATICTPSTPKCERCPISRRCVARAQGRQNELPLPKPRQERRHVTHVVVVVRDRAGRVLMERRGDGSTWAGLWQFATVEAAGTRIGAGALRAVCAELGLDAAGVNAAMCTPAKWIKPFERTLSHRHVRFVVYEVVGVVGGVGAVGLPEGRLGAKAARGLVDALPTHAAERRWVAVEGVAQLPLTTPQAMIAAAMVENVGVPTGVVRKDAVGMKKPVGGRPTSR
jgi:adenine-specific DNA glycosylase